MNFNFFLILGQLVLSHVNCLSKSYFALNQWFENSKIWSAKRLPCYLDTVILPDNVAMYLDKPISASRIILPKNGILILDQENWIKKVNENTCTKGQENKLVIRKNYWFDSANWNVKYHTFDFRGNDELTNPVPHINRIPCQQDEIRFKAKSTIKLSIDLENKNFNIKNLFINNKKLVSRDFERYSATKIGKLQFNIKGQFPFYVSNSGDDQSDHNVQICQNNFNYFLNKICANLINKCPKLNCIDPIQPTGFCCQICGSMVIIGHNKRQDKAVQNYKTLNNDFIENILINLHLDKYEKVNFFLSKLSESRIEIIILDQKDYSESKNEFKRQSRTFGQELTNFLKKENFYQLQSIEHQYSLEPFERTNSGLFLTIFILILILSVLLFVYNKSNLPQLNSIYRQVQHQVQTNLRDNCRTTTSSTDSPLTFLRFSSDHEDCNSLEMEISQPNQSRTSANYLLTLNQDNRNEFRLRTKADSISNSIGNSVLFTVDEQDENISFDNPFFKKEITLPDCEE